MNQELKDHISRCATCETYSAKQRKEPLIPHEIPTRTWAKVSCDLFELDKKTYLVTVDYYSCFFEVDHLQVSTSQAVIKKFKPHFARYGIPDTLVSDNGPQFISNEFQEFSEKFQFHHVTTSPYHHQSNGKAESAVKQAKRILRTCKASGVVRNTPQTIHETSPAQRLLNRRTKSTLSCIRKVAPTFSDDNYLDEEEPDRPGTESAVPTPPTPDQRRRCPSNDSSKGTHCKVQQRSDRNERCD